MDFEELINGSVSDGFFQFKAEKNWSTNISKYNELFSIDVDFLSMIINSIPFNQYVDIDDKYFEPNQLRALKATAEQSKAILEKEILRKKESQKRSNETASSTNSIKTGKTESQKSDDYDNGEDDLDLLLSLKEPVKPMAVNIPNVSKPSPAPAKAKSNDTFKSVDLEKWLDSVLDD